MSAGNEAKYTVSYQNTSNPGGFISTFNLFILIHCLFTLKNLRGDNLEVLEMYIPPYALSVEVHLTLNHFLVLQLYIIFFTELNFFYRFYPLENNIELE